ncbi:MFS transporter [Nonomuraea sp. NPDC050310]|uniref:MFS transporter n=1 Tax=unclassified Nonomuraea TaxID=2593643 RepID=UPI0033F70B76
MTDEPGIWRIPAFRRYLGADVLSQFGTQVTLVALPLVAYLTLGASPLQLGLITTAEMIAFLVLGLPAGVWVDRMRRRPVLVVADLVRALALLSVPVAHLLGVLSLAQLFAVALVMGVCTVFFDVAHMSFLPSVIAKSDLPRGIGALETCRSVAGVAGPGLGGWLVQVLSGPLAILADAVSYLLSALLLRGVRAKETPAPREERRSLRAELGEGVRYVLGHPVLRRVAVVGALAMLSNGLWAVVQPLYLIGELKLSAGVYGLILSSYALGGVAGAVLAPKVVERHGFGPAMYGGAALSMLFPLLMPLSGPGWQLVLYPLGGFLGLVSAVVFNVGQSSYRQLVTPDHLRGRMNASMRFLMWSAMPFGGLLGGVLAGALPIHQVLWITCLVVSVAHLPIVAAPSVRKLQVRQD